MKKDNSTDNLREKNAKFIIKTIGDVVNKAEREVPENGKFMPTGMFMKQVGSDLLGKFSIQYDPRNSKDGRILTFGVCDSFFGGKLYSNVMLTGTKKEILSYLKDEKNYLMFVKTIEDLTEEFNKNKD